MSKQTSGAGQPTLPPSPYQIQVSYGASQSVASTGIARGTGADWFGPLDPLNPIAPPDVAGRRFDYAPGYNLVTRPRAYEPIGFHELRAFADAYDLLRLVIETRKDQMERQRWRIRPRAGTLKRNGGSLDADAGARVSAIEHFFHKPDGVTRWKTCCARCWRTCSSSTRRRCSASAPAAANCLRCISSTAPPSSG